MNKVDYTSVRPLSSNSNSGVTKNSILRYGPTREFKIRIDGKQITVSDPFLNLVEIAKNVGITIPAPCYHAKRKKGCCMACVIEVNAEQRYACATKPVEGMEVVVNRDDLKAIRRERIQEYKSRIQDLNQKT